MTTLDEVQLIGGPADGLVVSSKYATPWPPPYAMRLFRLVGTMIGHDGSVIPPSQLRSCVDVYVRCSERRWRFDRTEEDR